MEAQLLTEVARGIGGAATGDPGVRAQRVAQVAAQHAVEVDSAARFPHEAAAALKAERLLGILVPKSLGGEGVALGDVADICYLLGQSCSSTAMIYAMHQVKIGCITRHMGRSRARERHFLRRPRGRRRHHGPPRCRCRPVRPGADRLPQERLHPDPPAGLGRARHARHLQRGYTLKAQGDAGQILPEPYEVIHSRTMVPFAHLLWGSVWAGIAAGATQRAQAFIRNAMRHANGQLPPGAPQFTKALTTLRTLRSMLATSLRSYENCMHDPKALAALDFQTLITLTKVEASELAAATVMSAMRACGLSGYRNDGDYTIGRYLRDVLSSPIMINNDRILANLAPSALVSPIPRFLRE